MSAPRYACILAGGSGTRLWPLSRGARPKQLLHLVGAGSLLRNTFDRLRPLVPPERVFILTEGSHAEGVRDELPEVPFENILVEPTRRGTAASLALPALIIHERAPNAVWASLHSDAFITEDAAFQANLDAAFSAAEQYPHLFTLGIVPSFPSTQFGYIHRAEQICTIGDIPAFRVERFVEKPPADVARRYVESGEYYWNPGVFVWSAESIRSQFQNLQPEICRMLEPLAALFGHPEFIDEYGRVYPTVPINTIDQGIMEQAPLVATMPALFGWADIGSWRELYDALKHDSDGNVVRGSLAAHETHGSLVFGGRRLIATVGVDDLVIVDTEDVLLVARRENAADVRKIVEQLEQQGRSDLL